MTARSWITMGPKRRPSDADDQILKQGCLIKSPPSSSYIFNKKASWKGRLLKLCRTALGSFVLRYYAYDGISEDLKGEIPVSDMKSIEVGSHMTERIATITRLFNISPNNVLCVKTDKRDYYLLDESMESIAEWQKCIMDAWMKVHQRMPVSAPRGPSTEAVYLPEEALRPKSFPEDYPCSETAHLEKLNRQRSHTDPEIRERDVLTPDGRRESIYEICREEDVISGQQGGDTAETYSQLLCGKIPQERRRLSAAAILQDGPESHRLSGEMTDPAYDSEPDVVYDTPRPYSVQMLEEAATEQEETSDLEPEEGDVYEKMASIVFDEVTHLPAEPPRNLPATPKARYSRTQRSQLKKAHILKMMYEAHSESDLVLIKLTVKTEHLQQYLGLQEIGDRLCVSKWKGPLPIGCLFHHGDQIESINGFRPGSKELFLQMLSNSIVEEVTLLLTRNMKAEVFHLEGCSCGAS